MRTIIKAWMSSKFDGIPPLTSEYAALERLKNQTISLLSSSAFNFNWIFFILAGNKDNYIVSNEVEIRPHPTMDYGVSCLGQFKKSLT